MSGSLECQGVLVEEMHGVMVLHEFLLTAEALHIVWDSPERKKRARAHQTMVSHAGWFSLLEFGIPVCVCLVGLPPGDRKLAAGSQVDGD